MSAPTSVEQLDVAGATYTDVGRVLGVTRQQAARIVNDQ